MPRLAVAIVLALISLSFANPTIDPKYDTQRQIDENHDPSNDKRYDEYVARRQAAQLSTQEPIDDEDYEHMQTGRIVATVSADDDYEFEQTGRIADDA